MPPANFIGGRTVALEVRHVATANFVIYSAILGRDPPTSVTVDGARDGPDNLLAEGFVEGPRGSGTYVGIERRLRAITFPVGFSESSPTRADPYPPSLERRG